MAHVSDDPLHDGVRVMEREHFKARQQRSN